MDKEIEKNLKDMEERIIKAIQKELDPEVRREKRNKKVYHNTKKLLKSYSKFVEHYHQTEFVSSTLIDDELLETIGYRIDDDNVDDVYIKSLFRTKERTAIILNHINRCINFLEKTAEQEKNTKKQRVVKVLKLFYIDGITAEDISERLFIDRSTVFKDLNTGAEELGPLIFGIDGLKLY